MTRRATIWLLVTAAQAVLIAGQQFLIERAERFAVGWEYSSHVWEKLARDQSVVMQDLSDVARDWRDLALQLRDGRDPPPVHAPKERGI